MKNKAVLSDINTARMELVLKKIPSPMTSGQIVRYLEKHTSKVPELLEEEGVSRSTFISRLVNTAKYGKNNKIAVMRKSNGEAKFHAGCGYQLYYDANKSNYTSADLDNMKHHAQGKDRPGARKKRKVEATPPRQLNSEFASHMIDDVRRFETFMKAAFSSQWSSLTTEERRDSYLNNWSKIRGNLEKMFFGEETTKIHCVTREFETLATPFEV